MIILVASLASTFAAPNPTGSLIVVLKEIYLFVWFVTMTTLLARLSDRDFRLVMSVWLAVVVPIEPVSKILANNTIPKTIAKAAEGRANTSGTNPSNWNKAALLALPASSDTLQTQKRA